MRKLNVYHFVRNWFTCPAAGHCCTLSRGSLRTGSRGTKSVAVNIWAWVYSIWCWGKVAPAFCQCSVVEVGTLCTDSLDFPLHLNMFIRTWMETEGWIVCEPSSVECFELCARKFVRSCVKANKHHTIFHPFYGGTIPYRSREKSNSAQSKSTKTVPHFRFLLLHGYMKLSSLLSVSSPNWPLTCIA